MTEYKNEHLHAAIEAILFTMGNAVEGDKIATALEITGEDLEKAVDAMQAKYDREDSGIRIIRLDTAYQMCTKAEYYEALISIASQPTKPVMPSALLEVMSIVAYKQPVTRAEIERIRGVSSDYSVNRLIEFGLIEEAGRLEAPGRPILFKTTENFLRQFGISSVMELPEISDSTVDQATEYAYRTAGFEMEGQMSFDLNLNEPEIIDPADPAEEDDSPLTVEI